MEKDKKVSDSSSSENLPKLEEKKDVTSFDEVDIDRHQRIFEKLGKSGKQQEEQTEDIQYVLDRIDELTLDQALKILRNTQEHHKNDLNFPESSRQLISELLSGPENFAKADYEFEVKAEAAIIYYFSPYPEVRAIANPHDNPDLPCETIRAYILGLIWAVIGQFINSFFNSRYPGITITSSVCQTLLYPCGEFVQYALPDWGITIRGTRHSLNPGPWNYKEQMFATIIFDVSLMSIYVFWNIQTQEIYYSDTWLTPAYKILLILSTQSMGLGFAGILRRFVVFPIEAIWPTYLPTLALNRALLVPESKQRVHGWSISRYNFFFIVFVAMFLYYWFPGFIFQALSYFSWLSWIKPNNFNLAVVTGSQLGLSFNPWPTFDWNLIGFFNPLSVPFFSFLQQYIGTFIGGLAILGVYFSNNKWTAYLPINSSGLYDNTGNDYNVTKVMTNGRLNEEMYKKYSPPFYTAGNLVLYGAFFLSYPLVFCYVLLDQWKVVVRAYGDIWRLIKESTRKTFTHTKSAFSNLFSGNVKGFFVELSKIFSGGGSVYDGFDDPFTRAIRSYPEVPNWWFYLVVLVSFIFSIIILTKYPLGTPVWTIFFVIGINLAFLVPMNLLNSIAGATIGLNVIAELIVGYALPGNPEALMFVKAYGYNIDGQASTYTSDQKMAHYARIPPRAVFRGQVLSTIITSFVGYGIVNFVDNSIQGICTPDQGEHFTCANGSLIYFSSSVIWGLIGPKRIFNDQYPVLKWMFLFGFLLAIAWWSIKKYGPSIREWVKSKAPELVYNVLNWTIFYPISLLRSTQPALVAIGFLEWAPLNLSFQTVGLYFSIYFMYYLRRNKTSWWERYNYVLSAALSAGLAFSGIIVFFAVQYHPQYINWWGNNVVLEGVDGYAGQVALKTELPEKGYFGPDEWA